MGKYDQCRHGEPEGHCAACAACVACNGECGTCPYAPMTPAVPDPTAEALSEAERQLIQIEVAALRAGHVHMRDVFAAVERILAARAAAPDALRVRLLAMADAWTTRDVLQRSGWAADCIRAEIERALLEDGTQ